MCIKLSPKFYEYMKFREWEQKDLAENLGYSEPFISMILSNQRGLSSNFMERLVRLTRLSFNELFTLSDEQGKLVRPDHHFEKHADIKIPEQNYLHL